MRLGVPVARLAPALALMADVALRPTFPEAELERLRQERLTELLQARDDAAAVASMAFARLLFGPSHRYGTGVGRHPGDDQEPHDVGPEGVPLRRLPAGERDPDRRRRYHG